MRPAAGTFELLSRQARVNFVRHNAANELESPVATFRQGKKHVLIVERITRPEQNTHTTNIGQHTFPFFILFLV